MKKIIVLVMSCNNDLFINQEHVIRETWAKDIMDKSVNNMQYFYYTASTDGKYHISYNEHYIAVPCDDGLYGTAEKTNKVFKFIETLGLDYEYIVRVNISTYVNLNMLNELLSLTYNNDTIYVTSILSKSYCGGPFRYSLVPNGKCMVIPRKYVKILIDNDIIAHAIMTNQIEIDYNECIKFHIEQPERMVGAFLVEKLCIDDYLNGLILNYMMLQKNIDPTTIYKAIGENDMFYIIPEHWHDYITLVFKDRTFNTGWKHHECDRSLEIQYLRELDNKIREYSNNTLDDVYYIMDKNEVFVQNDIISYRWADEETMNKLIANNDPELMDALTNYIKPMEEFRKWAKTHTKIPNIV